MASRRPLHHTRRYVQTHWPLFAALYGALFLGVLSIGLGLVTGWYALIPVALALMAVSAYLFVSTLWTVYQSHDAPGSTAAEILFGLSQARPEDRMVCIDLGLREMAIVAARNLTTGVVTVVDVYNPQSNPNHSLRRARKLARRPPNDPRLSWIDGGIDLLPLPDHSVGIVFMDRILSEFWLPDERSKLLAEVRRILIPEGRLLFAERIRSQADLALTRPATATLPSASQWRSELTAADYVIRREEILRGLVLCVRADKPSLTAGKQLALDLEYV